MRNVSSKNREATNSSRTELLASVVELDVTNTESVHMAAQPCLTEGQPDVLVNNGGHVAIGIMEAFTED
jgi:NAD(P)-dependent dehydrogenase (short-subunit alcohol dehydrogenase family)